MTVYHIYKVTWLDLWSNITISTQSDETINLDNVTDHQFTLQPPPRPRDYLDHMRRFFMRPTETFVNQTEGCDVYDTGNIIYHSNYYIACGGPEIRVAREWHKGKSFEDNWSYSRFPIELSVPGFLQFPEPHSTDTTEDELGYDENAGNGKSTHKPKFVLRRAGDRKTKLEPILKGSSRIECVLMDQGIPERFCKSKNIAIRVKSIPRPDPDARQLDLFAPMGTMQATCSLNEDVWFGARRFGTGAAGWFYNSLLIQDPEDSLTSDIQCDAWVDTPLFMISRWDTTNPYQAHQDMLNTFLVYSKLNLSADRIQPVLLDSRNADGPFVGAWSHLFTSSHNLIDIRQIIDKAIPNSKPDSDGILCLKSAVWGIHGGISPLSREARKARMCKAAPTILAFRAFMIDRIRRVVLGPRIAGTQIPGILNPSLLHSETIFRDSENSDLESIPGLSPSVDAPPSSPDQQLKLTKVDIPIQSNSTPLWVSLSIQHGSVRAILPVPDAHAFPHEKKQNVLQGLPNTITITYAIRQSRTKTKAVLGIFGKDLTNGVDSSSVRTGKRDFVGFDNEKVNQTAEGTTVQELGHGDQVVDEGGNLSENDMNSNNTMTAAISAPGSHRQRRDGLEGDEDGLSPRFRKKRQQGELRQYQHQREITSRRRDGQKFFGEDKPIIRYYNNRHDDSDPTKLSRLISNEDDLISLLRTSATSWGPSETHENQAKSSRSKSWKPVVKFRAVDFATLTFEDQVAISQGTDIFVGSHGASFIHLLYLRMEPLAGVLELKHPLRRNGNFQFHNLAVR
ncbi:hypothetical protein HDU76_008097, partial [Blyttiomyces sp. JEL0837]